MTREFPGSLRATLAQLPKGAQFMIAPKKLKALRHRYRFDFSKRFERLIREQGTVSRCRHGTHLVDLSEQYCRGWHIGGRYALPQQPDGFDDTTLETVRFTVPHRPPPVVHGQVAGVGWLEEMFSFWRPLDWAPRSQGNQVSSKARISVSRA
jgi:hypothetical protein